MAQRSFTVPMTEETIAELIKTLESKLTAGAFAKEQRALMTKKLREFIKNVIISLAATAATPFIKSRIFCWR